MKQQVLREVCPSARCHISSVHLLGQEVSMDLGINGLRVLVTAGASGIGLSIARSFESEGVRAAP